VEEEIIALAISKHEGAGNDFLVMVDLDDRVQLSTGEVRLLTDRHHGIGADGLIVLSGPSGGGELTMELFNHDGSIAEISGNGVRCAAHEAVRSGLVAEGSFSIMTGSGLRRVRCEESDGRKAQTSVVMGEVDVRELDAEARRATVDVGNPHLVLVVDGLDGLDVVAEGEALQKSREGGINVEWLAIADEAHAEIKVFERGVGPTLACGSGSVAAVGAARAMSLLGDRVEVINPGGTLDVSFDGDLATLSGEVRFIADLLTPLTRSL
jgi:diaminopimelate epimerase